MVTDECELIRYVLKYYNKNILPYLRELQFQLFFPPITAFRSLRNWIQASFILNSAEKGKGIFPWCIKKDYYHREPVTEKRRYNGWINISEFREENQFLSWLNCTVVRWDNVRKMVECGGMDGISFPFWSAWRTWIVWFLLSTSKTVWSFTFLHFFKERNCQMYHGSSGSLTNNHFGAGKTPSKAAI